jgi:hypothetical protein
MKWLSKPENRKWVYNVLLSVQPLVVAYGLATEQQTVLWLSVVSAVLGLGLARANVSE